MIHMPGFNHGGQGVRNPRDLPLRGWPLLAATQKTSNVPQDA
jgi:hypothetical protein